MITDREKSRIDESAPSVINHFALLLKTAQIHDLNNVAVDTSVRKFMELVNPLVSGEALSIQLLGENFYVNAGRVRYCSEYASNYDFLAGQMQRRSLGTVVFLEPLQIEDMKSFVSALLQCADSADPFNDLLSNLAGQEKIDIKMLKEVRSDEADYEKKRLIKKSYSSAVSVMKGVMERVRSGEKVHLARSKRVIGTIVDQIMEDELQSTLIGMTTIKDYDEYTYYHSVNVSILSIALGNRIGLPKKALAELGLAALFHDIGKVHIPIEILNKPEEFSDQDWELMRNHPWWGAVEIFGLKGINESSMNIAIAAFEHHMNCDHSGYPDVCNDMELDLFSRIIAIADRYDAMTSCRVYAKRAIPPDRALQIMYERSGSELDFGLLQVFSNMLGIYPVGCLVMLNTDEMGVVIRNHSKPELEENPVVLLIADSNGNRLDNIEADLSEKDENGEFRRRITRTLDPSRFGIDLSEYLI
jgi:HD-GYP domain-containing protein (c-di-GMP phosphodiesterase class II)